MDLSELYQQELKLLKESSKVFSADYPAITEAMNRDIVDPDVDMILQGVSYLTAQFKKELDDQFPVALQALSQVLTPTLMQPIPSISILSFTPKANLISPVTINRGANFDSLPVKLDEDGVDQLSCRFRSAWPVEVLPVNIANISQVVAERTIANVPSKVVELTIDLTSEKNDLANYDFENLHFYIDQPASDASIWLQMLSQNLTSIQVTNGTAVQNLPATSVKLTGLALDKTVFSSSDASNQHSILQEYFTIPEKLQFFEVDLAPWKQRSGGAFSIILQFKQPTWYLPDLSTRHLKLYCTPVVNEFEHFAEPMVMDGIQLEFGLTAQHRNSSTPVSLPIVDVVGVESVMRERERNTTYRNIVKPKSTNGQKSGFYFYRKHGTHDGDVSNWLALQFTSGIRPQSSEVLRVKLSCCHGKVAANIPPNTINVHTSTSSQLVSFTNLTTSSDYLPAQITTHEAWNVMSDQAISLKSIDNAEQLKLILQHHIPAQLKDTAKQKTLEHRIHAITELNVNAKDHFDNGLLIRGTQYLVSISAENFVNRGESFLFCCLIDQLLALQIPINSFSQLIVTDPRSGESHTWPINFGGMSK
jgi:type VI secretion system protein ImpG|tara:strand:- start:7957 stop:9726 length:1770 start_codon:yes stop_codon:yes gene_type:complete